METKPATPDAQPAATAVANDLWRFALLPFGLWWSTWSELLGPCHPVIAHHDVPEEEGQLIVPEPIEETGEHALFA